MKISVSSYSFQQYINRGMMRQFDCIAKAKEMGFDAIEFIDLEGSDYSEQIRNAHLFKQEADRIGIEINAYTICACLYYNSVEEEEREIDRLKKQLDIAQILGAKVSRTFI